MARIYRILFATSWGLGLLALAASVVLRLSPDLSLKFDVTARGGIIFAGSLFLAALATREMERG